MIVLASASPRRRELLGRFVPDLVIDPADGPEIVPEGASPEQAVLALSLGKARQTAQRHPGNIVIGADTVVALDGTILGKPRDEADAARMLRSLSGRTHTVCTGVTVISGDTVMSRAEATDVHFRGLTDREIAAYIATGEPMDKAGAYGIQGAASLFVKGIDGDYFNVDGLPLCLLGQMLETMGVSLL